MPPQGSSTPVQGQVHLTSDAPTDASTINRSRANKDTGKNKTPRSKVTKVESIHTTSSHKDKRRNGPRQEVDQIPEPEGNLHGDSEVLESLDTAAKKLYESDREVLECIENLKGRTVAILDHVKRADSQLRASNCIMEMMEQFIRHRQKMGKRCTLEDGSPRTKSNEPSDGESSARNPDLFPTMIRGKHSGLLTAEGHLPKGANHLDFHYDHARDLLGKSPNKEDESGLEYAEDEAEILPDNPALNRSGGDPRTTSNVAMLSPPSGETSKEPERDVTDIATVFAVQPPADASRPRHPLAQSYIPSSPELARKPGSEALHPVPRTPSPSRTLLGVKRKRMEDREVDGGAGKGVGPSAVYPPHQVKDKEDGVPVKRPRLFPPQSTWNFQMFPEANCVPAPSREDSQEPPSQSQPAHKPASPPSIPASQTQQEDSDLETSQVIELLSHGIDQESEDEEPTGNVLAGLRANGSAKSIRFNIDDEVEEKMHKVYPKTPVKPRSLRRVMEAEIALAAIAETESQDDPRPLPPPKRKRAVGARARKSRATPSTKATEVAGSASSETPSKSRRGRSPPVQLEIPTPKKTPIRKSARGRK